MKTLKDLTPELRVKIEQYKKACTEDLYSGVEFDNFNPEKTIEYVKKIYQIAKQEEPEVVIANDPIEYHKLFSELHLKYNPKKPVPAVTSHWLNECSVYARVYFTWFYFIHKELNIPFSQSALLEWLHKNSHNNIARCYFTNKFCLVLRIPRRIRRVTEFIHSTTKPAIEWPNYKMYYINGRKMPAKLFERTLEGKLTFQEFTKIQNDDDKAAIITMITENKGQAKLLKFLGAVVVDKTEIVHPSGHTEKVRLLKTTSSFPFVQDHKGNLNQPYAWVEMKCPSTGTIYLKNTSAAFNTAIEAMKFSRPNQIPFDLAYGFEHFNN